MTAASKCFTQFRTVAIFSGGLLLALAAPSVAQPAAKPAAQKTKASDVAAPKKPAPEKAPPTPPASAPRSAPGAAPTPAAAPRKFPPQPPIDTSSPPPSLPRASREKMRACAEEWEKMKRTTKTGLPMWRDFAAGCLTR